MNAVVDRRRPIPRLPVFGWEMFSGPPSSSLPSILDANRLLLTTSGRASILQALRMLGVGTGSQVLVPSYHCPTMIAPIIALGAEAIFFPILADGAADLAALESLATTRTKVVLAAHYFGIPQPMRALRKWCDGRGVSLIEDCAHCLFGISDGRPVGQWGDVAIASLTKFLPVPEGGCLVANDFGGIGRELPTLHARGTIPQIKAIVDILEDGARHLGMRGLNSILGSFFALKRRVRRQPADAVTSSVTPTAPPASGDQTDQLDQSLVGSAITAPCRWVVRSAARQRIVDRRRANYRALVAALSGDDSMHPLMPKLPDDCAPYVMPLWVEHPDPGFVKLREMGIPLFRWDRLWPGTPGRAGDHGIEWSHHVFQVPCHQDLSADEIRDIADSLRAVVSN